MKKYTLYVGLSVLFVLSGCHNQKSSAKSFDAQKILNQLQESYALSGTLNKKSSLLNSTDVTNENIPFDHYFAKDEYYLFSNNDIGQDDAHYFKNNYGQLITKSVNRHNQLEEYEMYNQDSSPAFFDKAFINPFTLLSDLDLKYDGKNYVTIKTDSDYMTNFTYGELVSLMFLGSAFEVKSLMIELDKNYMPSKLILQSPRLVTESSMGVPYNVTYTYQADFVTKEILKVPVPASFPKQEGNEEMKKILEFIQGKNYTVTAYDDVNGEKEEVFSALVTKKGFLATQGNETIGLIDDPNGGVAPVMVKLNENNQSYLQGTRPAMVEYTMENYLTPADFNLNLFSKTDDGFVLQTAYDELQYLVPDSMFTNNYTFINGPLTFNISEDYSKITYSYRYSFANTANLFVELTNFGRTSLPFNIQLDYKPFVTPTCWAEVDINAKLEIDSLLNGDMDQIIPFYYPTEQYSFFGVDQNTIIMEISIESAERGQEIINEYTSILLKNGFTFEKEADLQEMIYVNADGVKIGVVLLDIPAFNILSVQFYVYPAV